MNDITKETLIRIIAENMNLTVGEARELILNLANYVKENERVI